MAKTWKNVELTKEEFSRFRVALIDKGIRYEASECGDFIHIEVFVNDEQTDELDEILKNM